MTNFKYGRDVILSRHPHDTDRYYHVEPGEWVGDVLEGMKYMDRENFLTIQICLLIFHAPDRVSAVNSDKVSVHSSSIVIKSAVPGIAIVIASRCPEPGRLC